MHEARCPAFRRVLLKLSGEALMGNRDWCMDHFACEHIAKPCRRLSAILRGEPQAASQRKRPETIP